MVFSCKRISLLLILVLFLILLPIVALSQNEALKKDIAYTANFYADYVDMFGEPPNVLIVGKEAGKERVTLAQAAYLFSSALSGRSEKPIGIKDIKGYNDNFYTSSESEVSKADLIDAAKLYAGYLEKNMELPYLVKINNVFISNSDFIYLLADMLRADFEGMAKDKIRIKRHYFESTISWNSEYANNNQYSIFSVDYEGDRPVFSEEYDSQRQSKQANSTKDSAVNPGFINKTCYGGFCTLPDDYSTRKYTSEEVAWFTTVTDSSGNTIFPACYPYCGAVDGTGILVNNFILRYNIPMIWLMNGQSIIAIAADNETTIQKIKGLHESRLLDLGLHTMYHTNMKKVPQESMEQALKENAELFRRAFNLSPLEFRSPYSDLSKENKHIEVLASLNVSSDNEIQEIDAYCNAKNRCNYEYNISGIRIIKVDWVGDKEDSLLNTFFIHPWELLFVQKGLPTRLEFSEGAKVNAFRNWMLSIGKYGIMPVLPREMIENEEKQ